MPKKKKKIKENSIEKHDETNANEEEEYLNPEYIKYNLDIANKLKIQKIVVAKHQQQRRQTMWNFPHIKKTKKDDNLDF